MSLKNRSDDARVSDNGLYEEDTEPVSDSGQSVSDSDQPMDVQSTPELATPRSKINHYSLRDSTRRPKRFT